MRVFLFGIAVGLALGYAAVKLGQYAVQAIDAQIDEQFQYRRQHGL